MGLQKRWIFHCRINFSYLLIPQLSGALLKAGEGEPSCLLSAVLIHHLRPQNLFSASIIFNKILITHRESLAPSHSYLHNPGCPYIFRSSSRRNRPAASGFPAVILVTKTSSLCEVSRLYSALFIILSPVVMDGVRGGEVSGCSRLYCERVTGCHKCHNYQGWMARCNVTCTVYCVYCAHYTDIHQPDHPAPHMSQH